MQLPHVTEEIENLMWTWHYKVEDIGLRPLHDLHEIGTYRADHASLYVCMYVCTYVRMYVCMYVRP
jgi:hypothetical protein